MCTHAYTHSLALALALSRALSLAHTHMHTHTHTHTHTCTHTRKARYSHAVARQSDGQQVEHARILPPHKHAAGEQITAVEEAEENKKKGKANTARCKGK